MQGIRHIRVCHVSCRQQVTATKMMELLMISSQTFHLLVIEPIISTHTHDAAQRPRRSVGVPIRPCVAATTLQKAQYMACYY